MRARQTSAVLLAVIAIPVAVSSKSVHAQKAPSSRLRTVAGVAESVIHPPTPCRGGVRVTEEELAAEDAKIQRNVLSSQKFTVIAGSSRTGKVVAKFTTDRAGKFSLRLRAGEYCIAQGHVGSAKPPKNDPAAPVAAPSPNVDADCLRARSMPTCDAMIYVQDTTASKVKLELHTYTQGCQAQWAQPCWRGPMPP
jgi:hypothetical protein